MAYIGHSPSTGEDNNFKILDDISSYTLTFDGSSSGVVSTSAETIYSYNHRFVQGQRVTYNNGGGGNIAGLTSGTVYFIIKQDHNNIKLATSASNAQSGTAVNITAVGSGTSHTLNVAFDGVNTKFKATHTTGKKARITRGAQLVLSVNGVIQQPHDSSTPSTGFGFDLDSTIVFSQAPASTDAFWGHILTNNNVTFDISDNKVDHFSGDGSTSSFTLSKSPPNNENILVTIDGVVQYPNDGAGNIRAYSVAANVINFTTAPGSGTQIEVRHIGFAGATTGSGGGGVTGVYGRTGNVVLIDSDNITVNDAAITGDATITGDLTVNGTTTTLDTVLTEVDQLLVAANNTTVGAAITQSGSGGILRLFDSTTQVFSVEDGGAVTASGSITANNSLTVAEDVTIKNAKSLYLANDAENKSARIYNSASTGAANLTFMTVPSGGSEATALSLDPDLNATFGSSLTIPDSIIHTGDANTKIRFPGNDTFQVETDGSARLKITDSDLTILDYAAGDKVGIGTNVLVAKLDVKTNANIPVIKLNDSHYNKYLTIRGGGSPNRMVIDSYEGGGGGADIDLASNGSTKVRIKSDGKVGINSTAPADLLTIGAGANTLAFGAKDTTRGNHIWQLLNNDGSGNAEFRLYKNSVSGTHAQSINFATSGDANYILDGNFGIGIAAPTSLLHLKGSAPRITLTDTAGSDDYAKIFSTAGALYFQQRDDSAHGEIIFRTENNSGAVERMRITNGGHILLNGGTIYGDDSALPTFTIANTSGNSNNCKITLGENVGSDNGGIAFYTAGSSSSDLKMRIRGNNNFIDIIDDNILRFNDGKVTFNHTGSHGFLTNTTGTFYIKSDTISLNKEDGTNVMWTNGSEMRFYPSDYGFGGAVAGGTPAGKNVFLAIGDSDTGIVQDGDGQLELWANNNEVANINAIDGYTSTKPISTSGDITASGGAGAITLAANSDIRMATGSWTGDYGAKIQHHDNYLFLQGGSNGVNLRNAAGSRQLNMSNDGHFGPANGQAYNLGSSSLPWAQGYFSDHIYIADTICHIGDTNTKIRFPSNDTIQLETGGTSHVVLDANGQLQVGVNNGGTVWNQTDSGTRFHTHLCTGSFYSGTGAIVIRTMIPSHDVSGHTMFSVRITGYWYSSTTGGAIDCVVGCYSGENNYYNASITGTYPNNWQGDQVKFAKCTSGTYNNKLVIVLGTTSGSNDCEIACTDFVQGFSGTSISYAKNWTMIKTTDISDYNGNPQPAKHRANEHYNEEFRTIGDGYGELMLARKGKRSTIQGEYQYTQINQGSQYKHYIKSPNGDNDITDDFAGQNWSALISVGVVGTSTVNTACHYYAYDNSDNNNQIVLQHRFGNSSGNSNQCYMQLYNNKAAWLMDHATNYRVTVRVKFLTGGEDGSTYTTAEGDYGSN